MAGGILTMGAPRSRYGRRFGNKKTSKATKRVLNKSKLGRVVGNLKKRVKEIERAEPKIATNAGIVSANAEIDDTTVTNVDLLNGIAQGDTALTREGDYIYVDKVKVHFHCKDKLQKALFNVLGL